MAWQNCDFCSNSFIQGAKLDLLGPVDFLRVGPLKAEDCSNNFNAIFIILRKCLKIYHELASFIKYEKILRKQLSCTGWGPLGG